MKQADLTYYNNIGMEANYTKATNISMAAKAGKPSAIRIVAFHSDNDEEKFKYFKLSIKLLLPSPNKQD